MHVPKLSMRASDLTQLDTENVWSELSLKTHPRALGPPKHQSCQQKSTGFDSDSNAANIQTLCCVFFSFFFSPAGWEADVITSQCTHIDTARYACVCTCCWTREGTQAPSALLINTSETPGHNDRPHPHEVSPCLGPALAFSGLQSGRNHCISGLCGQIHRASCLPCFLLGPIDTHVFTESVFAASTIPVPSSPPLSPLLLVPSNMHTASCIFAPLHADRQTDVLAS